MTSRPMRSCTTLPPGGKKGRPRVQFTTTLHGGDVVTLLNAYPAPPNIGAHLYAQGTICKLIARCTQEGKSIDQAIAETESEIEGYTRT